MEFDSGDDIKQYWDDDDDDDKAELEKEFIDYMEQRFLTGIFFIFNIQLG